MERILNTRSTTFSFITGLFRIHTHILCSAEREGN